MKDWWLLLKKTYQAWRADNGQRMGAALAYYTLFSLAPLLLIAISIAGAFFGRSAARALVLDKIQDQFGPKSAQAVGKLLLNLSKPGRGAIASATGTITLLLGASGVMGELHASINQIWKVPARRSRLGAYIRTRVVSLAFALAVGFLLLVSLLLSAVVAALSHFVSAVLPVPAVALQLLNMAVSFGVVTLLFAVMYKFLPDADVEWRDVWTGAAFTSFLFLLGNFLLGIYLGTRGLGSAYGAAGSLVVIVMWAYYCAQILYLGAEFTHVYAVARASKPGSSA